MIKFKLYCFKSNTGSVHLLHLISFIHKTMSLLPTTGSPGGTKDH